ncbi:DUF3558 family protein [Nocardia sp. NPDC051030]|uniref:DUF3558 family protein n=1 Tax=Nocardia sp. NPDC051030 TaxID=3155162 RepID=UPI0034415BD2
MRAKLVGVLVVGLAFGAVSGCSDSESTPTGMFDPCAEISDNAIKSAGFDPATKESVQGVTPYSVRCRISSSGRSGSLGLEHPNGVAPPRTYEAYLASAQSVANSPGGQAPTVTQINGRDAYVGPQSILGCAVHLRTATGVLSISVNYFDANNCPSAERVSAILEPSIGDR